VVESPEIHGSCDERFAPVRDAMARNFREHNELGAAVAVTIDGRFVVDLWGGWMDEERRRPWQGETLVNVFSVGKGVASLAVHMLVERGGLDLAAPVAHYWPEFAAAGKGAITVAMLLAHRAGLPAIRQPLPEHAMYDWEQMTAALAAEEPWWQPGTRHGYHVNTFGFLAGELVQRAAGMTIGEFVRREIAAPLAADFHFGIGAADDARIADYVFGAEMFAAESAKARDMDEERKFLLGSVYMNPPAVSGPGVVNTRAWRAAEMPSTNGHSNARAVARIYAALAAGGAGGDFRLLERETLARATAEAASGPDFVLRRPSRFALGFQLPQPERPLGTSPNSFGHFGAGGSLGFADPDARLAFAYTMNRAGPRFNNPCTSNLVDALYGSLVAGR